MFCGPALKAVSSCLVAFVSVQHFASGTDRQSQDDQIQASCVHLFGASGPLSHAINGSYDITHDVADGYNIYAKRVWFELSASAPSKALWIMVTYDRNTGQSE
jgi:hypothetical protein